MVAQAVRGALAKNRQKSTQLLLVKKFHATVKTFLRGFFVEQMLFLNHSKFYIELFRRSNFSFTSTDVFTKWSFVEDLNNSKVIGISMIEFRTIVAKKDDHGTIRSWTIVFY